MLPPGEMGEVCIIGPQVMKGYWKKPEETEEAFRRLDRPAHRRHGLHGRGRLPLPGRPPKDLILSGATTSIRA